MATITPNPFVMKDSLITIGTDNYEAAVTSVVLTPSSSIQTIKGLTPTAVFSEGTTATWTADITFMQDWSSPASLGKYLFDNEGETVSAVIEPIAGGVGFEVDLIITPGAIGGSVDAYATATVSLGVAGKPVLVPAA